MMFIGLKKQFFTRMTSNAATLESLSLGFPREWDSFKGGFESGLATWPEGAITLTLATLFAYGAAWANGLQFHSLLYSEDCPVGRSCSLTSHHIGSKNNMALLTAWMGHSPFSVLDYLRPYRKESWKNRHATITEEKEADGWQCEKKCWRPGIWIGLSPRVNRTSAQSPTSM